jgi:hypothetical protein
VRYLVKAKVKPGKSKSLLRSIADGTLGKGSIAGDEYIHNMNQARVRASQPGSKPVFVIRRWRRNGRIGKNISSSSGCRTRIRAAIAGTRTGPNRGRAAIATVRRSWKRSCAAKANPSSKRCGRANCRGRGTKLQTPSSKEAPTIKLQTGVASNWLELGIWEFSRYWGLGFRVFHNASTYHDA